VSYVTKCLKIDLGQSFLIGLAENQTEEVPEKLLEHVSLFMDTEMRGIQVTIVVEEIGDGDKTVRNGILSNR
jgi:hypothetical protein